MRLAMAQIQMSDHSKKNLDKTLDFIKRAKDQKADLIFFPEIQLSPFFPQYKTFDKAEEYLLSPDSPEIKAIQNACREFQIYASPNVYLSLNGKRYDASLMINRQGNIIGISKMVNIANAPHFYEQNYYSPSHDGFKVYDTPFGKIGVVICFDRHFPESVRQSVSQGAELILIPTANLKAEPTELFEWEIRVQAFQNSVFIAMCNRVGKEGEVEFCGESLIASPRGERIYKSDDKERLITCQLELDAVQYNINKRKE